MTVPALIVLLSWHRLALEPRPGLDPSWTAALHMAIHDKISFGDHLVFTFGPLGFLSVPTLWYSGTGVLAGLYTVVVRGVLAAALFVCARRTYGTIMGAVVALLVASASSVTLAAVPFLAFCVWVVDRVGSHRRLLVLMAVGGAVAGLELLNKESVGITITALAIITALAAPGRRRDQLLAMLGGLAVSLSAFWTLTGQNWGALFAYVHNAERIVSGYAAAQSYEDPSLKWEYTAGWVAFAFGVVGAMHMTATATARRRWGILALWVAFCFFEYKEAFVRHDAGHGAIYFVALLGGFLALRWRRGSRPVGLGLAAALFAFVIAAESSSFSAAFDPGGNTSLAFKQLRLVFDSRKREAITAQGRRAIEAVFPIDPETLSLLRGHTVHVAPYQASLVWAYRLKWRPLPVFQSYSAYTTGLDQVDANALNSATAPQRILRNRDPIFDRRIQAFDEGLTTRTILCRYEELHTTSAWQVLGVGPNRCAAPVPLGVVRAGWDQSVPVPLPPNDQSFVFARIDGVAVGGIERMRAVIYKPALRTVILDGVPHRLIEGTASDGLILRAPAGVDFTAPFNFAPNSATIAVGKEGQGRGGGRPITFSFFAQPVVVGPRYAPLQRALTGGAPSILPTARER